MRVALFANDAFGSYVFDAVRDAPCELVCAVGETASGKGRAIRKLRALRRRPSRLFDMIRARLSPEPTPPREPSRSPAAGLPPVHERCAALGIPFFEDYRLAQPAFAGVLAGFDLDLILVTTFGAILRPHILAVPRRGTVNFHFALLPKYRGLTPELCCLLDGARETGVTAHFIDEGVDTGPIIKQARVTVGDRDDFAALQQALYPTGRALVAEVLEAFAAGSVTATPQDESAASLCRLPSGFQSISTTDTPGARIHNVLRACLGTRFPPYLEPGPGQSHRTYLLDAEFVHGTDAVVPDARRAIRCRDGVLLARRTWDQGGGLATY